MTVLIVTFNNLSKCPYVNPYVKFCKEHGIGYEIIYPNRSGSSEAWEGSRYEVAWKKSAGKPVNFLHFRSAVLSHLKRKRYDFVIILTTFPAVLMSSYMSRHYKGRYLVDIRDYTYEKNKLYFALEKRAIRHSAINVISSPGFRNFLPEGQYLLCHNVNDTYRKASCRRFAPSENDRLIIGYVGSISYKKQCIKMIDLVKEDDRFCLHFYGDEVTDHQVTEYVASLNCERIRTFGPYHPQEKDEILSKVDILFGAYGNGRELLIHALSNKLYDSFHMGLPLLTSSSTAMSEAAADFSFDLDPDQSDSLDRVYQWYYQIDADAFHGYSQNYMRKVFEQQDEFYAHLYNAIVR